MLSLTSGALIVQLTGTLEICDVCALSKAKECALRKKMYTWATNPGESIILDTTGPLP